MIDFDFQQLKLLLLDTTGLAKDALHIHVGLALFIATRLVWRWRGGWTVAWLVALAATLGGEWSDALGEDKVHFPTPDGAHWHDIWNTMLWPTVLLLIGRWLEPRRKPTPAPKAEPSGDNAEHAFE
ncbi:MAG: hypothetical protein K2X31_01295 [Sphingopyxis sp.]|nr:hypothetical protein [Sphingopyxis sp.]